MDENFSMTLEGRNGPREVSIAELWEDNMHSIVHAYNKQMLVLWRSDSFVSKTLSGTLTGCSKVPH